MQRRYLEKLVDSEMGKVVLSKENSVWGYISFTVKTASRNNSKKHLFHMNV